MALDPNLSALLTKSVSWQSKTGTDKYGQDTWAAAVSLKCYPSYGSKQVQRRDGTVYESSMSLYFDGNDANVQTFQLGDKFTSPGMAGGQTQEAVEITPEFSPGPSLNEGMTQWMVEVML